MKKLAALTVRLIRAAQKAYARKWSFLGVFCIVFFLSVGMFGHFDLLPVLRQAVQSPASGAADTSVPAMAELPAAVTVPAIGLSAQIANPVSTDTGILDQALLSGAVRYPTSAKLGETGNVVLFGHSSYLPIVGNQAYKTFNNIQKLKAGDTIIVSSSEVAYVYKVRSVTKEDANQAIIPLSVPGQVLTLSTCDSFAKKTDRFVVVADFVERQSLPI